MLNLIYYFLFITFSLYVLLKTIFYGLYEIKTQNNKSGGIGVIILSTFVTIFANVIVFMK